MKNMKKILLFLLFAIAAMTVNAQTTYNVRAGMGQVPVTYNSYEDRYLSVVKGTTCTFQVNAPINSYNTLTISPTLSYTFSEEGFFFDLPVYIGYKVPMRGHSILYPKIGPTIVAEDGFYFGYSAELTWEYKRFVLGADCYYLVESEDVDDTGFRFFVGYKF